MPVHDSSVRSVKLYDVNTIDGAPGPNLATIAVASTFTWSGNGSPGGGPAHSHCSPGKNTPGTGVRRQLGSLMPPGPTPHGKHSLAAVSQCWSPAHSALPSQTVGRGTHVS